jgi:hypothetical protein
LTGQTEVHATLHGPLKNKKLLEAHVTIPTLKLAYSNTIQLAETSPIRVDYKDTVITLQRSGLKGTDTDLQFQGSMSTAKGAPVSLLLLGTVNLQLAQVFAPDIKSSGELKFNINSNGATEQSRLRRPGRDRGCQLCQRRSAGRLAARKRRADADQGPAQHHKISGHRRRWYGDGAGWSRVSSWDPI